MQQFSQEDKDFLQFQFSAINEKMDLLIGSLREDVIEGKWKVQNHETRIGTLEQFKEGHQQKHKAEEGAERASTTARRFRWEIVASSGLLGMFGVLGTWLFKS